MDKCRTGQKVRHWRGQALPKLQPVEVHQTLLPLKALHCGGAGHQDHRKFRTILVLTAIAPSKPSLDPARSRATRGVIAVVPSSLASTPSGSSAQRRSHSIGGARNPPELQPVEVHDQALARTTLASRKPRSPHDIHPASGRPSCFVRAHTSPNL